MATPLATEAQQGIVEAWTVQVTTTMSCVPVSTQRMTWWSLLPWTRLSGCGTSLGCAKRRSRPAARTSCACLRSGLQQSLSLISQQHADLGSLLGVRCVCLSNLTLLMLRAKGWKISGFPVRLNSGFLADQILVCSQLPPEHLGTTLYLLLPPLLCISTAFFD